MNTGRLATAAALFLLISGGWWLGAWLRFPDAPTRRDGNPEKVLNAWLKETEPAYRAELNPRPLVFPQDHGSHAEAPLESWQFAGSLVSAEGRRLGFHWSLLRLGLGPERPARKSAWAPGGVYRGVFTLSDPAGVGYRWSERFSRSALGLAGSGNGTPRIWLEDWALSISEGANEPPAFILKAKADDTAVELELRPLKPPLRLGDDELSGAAGARLRAYLSSRLQVDGRVEVEGSSFPVTGQAWFDHAWGRVFLPGGQTALNQFRLQLDDGREILIFQWHRRDGSAEPINRGLWIDPAGGINPIERDGLEIQPSGHWASPATQARYPVQWRILLPRQNLELELLPLLEDQEIEGLRPSWSGTVSVRGRIGDSKPVAGSGFVELTGY